MAKARSSNESGDSFPVIDISEFHSNPGGIAAALFDAACRWGFLVLKGHGIPREDVDDMFSLSEQFFNQPQEVKAEKRLNMEGQGYDLKDSAIGVHEAVCFGNVADANLSADNFSSWWTSERRQRVEAFRRTCHVLCEAVLSALALAMGLDRDFFSAAHDPRKPPGNALRLVRYHKLSRPPEKDHPRLCEHTDWGTMTMLFARAPGLEVRTPGDDAWIAAPVVDDAIVVNFADGLALLSGKAIKSTAHRLTWESTPWDKERYSMPYFCNANADVPIKILRRLENRKFTAEGQPTLATFGDYQQVRVRLIESHDMPDNGLHNMTVDPKLAALVKELGVARGPGFSPSSYVPG